MNPEQALAAYSDRATQVGAEAALEAVDAAVANYPDAVGDMERVLPRIPVVIARAREVLREADVFRLHPAHLISIRSHAEQVTIHLNAGAAGEDRSTAIDSELDSLLDDVALIAAATSTLPAATGEESVAALRAVLFRGQAEISERAAELAAELDQLDVTANGATSRLAELQASLAVATDEITAYKAAGATEVDAIRTANSSALAEFRTTFDAVTAESVAAGKAQIKELIDEAAAAQVTQAANAKAVLDAHETQADEILEVLKEKETEVMKVASALGSKAQSAGWGGYADQQRTAANWMLAGAIVGFLGAAGVAVWIAVATAKAPQDISWNRVVTKLAVTTALGLVGGYLASQSSEHRHQERIARRRHLDLLALPLFIAQLDDTKKEEIIVKHAADGFLAPDPAPQPKNPRKGIPISQLAEIITAAKAPPK